jgi:hypothetical protein
VVGRTGVPEDIPEVIWFIGIAPGAPVMVLGGVWEVVTGIGVETLELTELDGMGEEPTELGFCLSAR